MLTTVSDKPRIVKIAEEYVRVLSLDFIASMNSGNFDCVGCQHFSPQVNAVHDAAQHSHYATSRTDTLDFMSRFLKENPEYRTEVQDISVDVNEATGTASVWILRTCDGLADFMRRENVCHLTWQWEEGDWYCIEYEAIRYFPFFTIEALQGGGL
jgi:hypothetical protein